MCVGRADRSHEQLIRRADAFVIDKKTPPKRAAFSAMAVSGAGGAD
jgi:hypothetical protein